MEMPGQIEIDLAVMDSPDSVIRAADLPIPVSATLLTDSEELVVRIELPRVAEEVAATEEGSEEDAEGGAEEESEE